MGKRGGTKRGPNAHWGSQNLISLREESTGKRQTKGRGRGGSTNLRSVLRHEHLQKLAVWTSGEASIPSLAAFFGNRLASDGEVAGIEPDPQWFTCQRCETILQPGSNCTVRIEKNLRRRKKPNTSFPKNNVVYKCHFCSQCNFRRGTPKGHLKDILPLKPKTTPFSKPAKSTFPKIVSSGETTRRRDKVHKADHIAAAAVAEDTHITSSPTTPMVRPATTTLLDSIRKKRNRRGIKKPTEPESSSAATETERNISTSSKRKRKSWTSLKEIAESNQHDKCNFKVPFFL